MGRGRAAAQGYKPGQRLLQSLQEKTAKAKTAVKPKQRKANNQISEMERIEIAVKDLLRQIAGRIANNGALNHGDPQVEEITDAIQVTIPNIVIHAGNGSVCDIGTVVAHVRRRDARFDDITLALPDKVRIRQADGTNGRITIAKRLAKLRWDRQLKTSTEFEFRLSELVFSLETGGEMGRVGEVLVRANVLEKKGLWTGPMRFALNNVNIFDGADSTLRLGQFNLILDLHGLDMAAMNENSSRKDADDKTGGAASIPTLEQILGLARGVGLRTEINNFAVQHPAQGDVKLAQAVYGLDLSSDDGKLLNLVLTTNHHGLNCTGGAPADGLVPRDLDVVMALENLPSETIVNVGVAVVIEAALLGNINSGPQAFERLRQELSAAGTVLRIKHASINAEGYEINISGSLLTDVAAKAGIVGDGDLRIRGLEKLLAALGPKGKAGPISSKGFLPLAALDKSGQPIDGGAGQSFSLTIRPDGQLTVNGEPVLSLVPFGDQARQ